MKDLVRFCLLESKKDQLRQIREKWVIKKVKNKKR